MPQELKTKPHSATEKGGGSRGGPRRWTGNGPRPARHVPWPEIFKHHISVLEGHFKMLDMVRKHTVEGTGNHRTICTMIQRTQESLRQSKDAQRNFVAPNTRDQVPIGSSSASMYPGYSPADIVYGQAAEEVGQQWSHANREGLALNGDDLEYEIGQSRGGKRHKVPVSELKPKKRQHEDDQPETSRYPARDGETPADKENEAAKGAEGEEVNPYFVVDTNPTPVKESHTTDAKKEKKSKKRKADQESTEIPERKKNKKRESDVLNGKPGQNQGKTGSDATGEASRPKSSKIEKKRKAETAVVEDVATGEPEKKKKKKKKANKAHDADDPVAV